MRILSIPLTGLFLSTSLLMLGIPAQASSTAAEGDWVVLTATPIRARDSAWGFCLDGKDASWLAYYDAAGNPQLRHPDGVIEGISREGGMEKPSGLAMACLGTGAVVLFRDKFPDKGLYLHGTDEKLRTIGELSQDTQVLPRFEVLRHQDQLDIVWLGEKKIPETNSRHNLYYRSINLAEPAVSATTRIMPGIYPMMAKDDKGNTMMASWNTDRPPFHMAARYLPAGAEEFGPEVSIAHLPNMAPLYKIYTNGGRWFVLWSAMREPPEFPEFMLEGAYSDDHGATWQRFTLSELNGIDTSSLDVAVHRDGTILMAMSGRDRQLSEETKHQLYLFRSEDNGATWKRVQVPRKGPFPPEEVNARYPKIGFGPKEGQVLLIWEEWGEIRSRIYASISEDNGQTWPDGIRLPQSRDKNLGLRPDGQNLFKANDGSFHLIAHLATDDTLENYQLVKLRVSDQDLEQWGRKANETVVAGSQVQRLGQTTAGASAGSEAAASKPVPVGGEKEADRSVVPSNDLASPSEEALRSRAQDFWKAMVAAEYDNAYVLYDPFFKAKVNPIQFSNTLGRIKYHQFDVGRVTINGNIATVETTVLASVPEFRVPSTGEMVKRPEREITMKDTWLWVDDNWYREYKGGQEGKRYTRY